MTTSEKIEQIEKEQDILSNMMLDAYRSYGWKFDEKPCSDVIGVLKDEWSIEYHIKIEDGTCPDIIGALTWIFATGGCIFEGTLETVEEVHMLMKMLGFEKQ